MDGLFVLLMMIPLVLIIWLLVSGPRGRGLAPRASVVDRRRRVYHRAQTDRVQTAPAQGERTRPVPTVDGVPEIFTIESAGVVVPEVVVEPDAMVTAAGQAYVETKAHAAHERTPAYQAAAASNAAQATAGTPLAEEAQLRLIEP